LVFIHADVIYYLDFMNSTMFGARDFIRQTGQMSTDAACATFKNVKAGTVVHGAYAMQYARCQSSSHRFRAYR